MSLSSRDVPETFTFTALSPGIGFGEVKKPQAQPRVGATPALVDKGARSAAPVQRAVVPSPMPAAPMPGAQAPVPAPAKPGMKLSLERKLMAWAVDFVFVTSTLAVAAGGATALAAYKAGKSANWLELKPVTWLAAVSPYEILAGVYAIYLAYNLMFRFVVGRTFGESLLGIRARRVFRGAP